MDELVEVGTKLLYENDKVRIWEIDLAPGEETAMHHHELDYSVIVVEGDRFAGVPQEGSGGRAIEADLERGKPFGPMTRGGIERAVNIGTQRFYEIQVELKD